MDIGLRVVEVVVEHVVTREMLHDSCSGTVIVFKLGNLLLFYLHTIGALLREGARLTATLQTCHKIAGKVHMDVCVCVCVCVNEYMDP